MGRRKLSDEEKENRKKKEIKDISESKDEQLTTFTKPKKILLNEETVKKYSKEMTLVGELSGLSNHNIAGFSGNKNYEDAILECLIWRDGFNKKYPDKKIKLINFFAQEQPGKSILVSYELK